MPSSFSMVLITQSPNHVCMLNQIMFRRNLQRITITSVFIIKAGLLEEQVHRLQRDFAAVL